LLITDTFTDSENTLIENHIPDYQATSGSYRVMLTFGSIPISAKIISNSARGTANSTITSAVVIETGRSDAIISCDVNKNNSTQNAGGMGLSFRFNGSTGYYVDLINNTIRLSKTNGTAAVVITTVSFPHSTTTTYNVKVVLNGPNIKVYVDNALYIDLNDTSYTGTEHGFGLLTTSTTKTLADNLLITTL
jgi:hypothetical protein